MTPRFLPGRRAADPEAALEMLRSAPPRAGVLCEEVPSPSRLAPTSVAFTAEVPAADPEAEPLAAGRFVLLHDPDSPEEWGGDWRVVTFASSPVESELAHDPLFGEVGRAWLQECLAQQGCHLETLSGTSTRVTSEPFGAREHLGPEVTLEVRSSWTPLDADLLRHFDAWRDLLCTIAGLPPVPELPQGVVALHGVR
ncbi:DUF3000 family protein [Kytococcus schroeteri]|uniref:DUF3000 family protein n=1 Tax=Kytococcus schroeteri TaxID=138300 RepID=UPI001145021E|nr:DUF3000 family protein [Kytococcus schroeteri]